METKFGDKKDIYEGGAIRNSREGKGRYDLIPTKALIRLARVYEVGGKAHGDRNWEKGIPTDRLIDSAIRHIIQYWDGMRDEDHLAQSIWNLMAIIYFEEKNT